MYLQKVMSLLVFVSYTLPHLCTVKVWKSWGPCPTVSGCWTMTRTMPPPVPYTLPHLCTVKVWKSWGPCPTVSGCWTMTRTMPLPVPYTLPHLCTVKVWKSCGPCPTVSGCWTMTRTMPLLVPYAISIQLPQRLVFGVRYTDIAVTLSPAGSLNANIFIKVATSSTVLQVYHFL
jgi:hypothetical protein